MFKILMFVALAASSAAFGQHLITATRHLMAGEQALAHIDPYSTAAQQNRQLAAAMGQINQARAGAQQAQQP